MELVGFLLGAIASAYGLYRVTYQDLNITSEVLRLSNGKAVLTDDDDIF